MSIWKIRTLVALFTLGLLLGCKNKEQAQKSPGEKNTIYAQLMQKVPHGSKYMRPKSAELGTLLETGQIDYYFSYKSVALQKGLKFLEFPAEINQGNPDFEPFYRKSSTKLSDGTQKRGQLINFGLTIPKNAPNPKLSIEMVKLFLGPEGRSLTEKSGLPVISPLVTEDINTVPEPLRGFFEKKDFTPVPPADLKVTQKTPFRIFHAGSLTVTLHDFEKMVESQYPNIDVINEPNGSITAVKQITELHKTADLLAVADDSIINDLMVPDFADWSGIFARNEMALIFNDKSHYASEINAQNWMDILLRKDVTFGRSDPDQDPSGYYTEILWKLSDVFYKLDERGKKRLYSMVERVRDSKRGVLIKIIEKDKTLAEISRDEFNEWITSDFQVKENPIKRGISLVNLLKKNKISLKPGDAVTISGKGDGSFSYDDLVKKRVGLVITRRGDPKAVAQNSDIKVHIAHVRSIEISRK